MPDRRHADPQRDKHIAKLRENGLTIDIIAERTGMSKRAVQQRLAAIMKKSSPLRHRHMSRCDPPPEAVYRQKLGDNATDLAKTCEKATGQPVPPLQLLPDDQVDPRRPTRHLLGVLDSRGIRIHAVAEATCVSLLELRLVEFGSPHEHEAAERLIARGMRMVIVSEPKTRTRWTPAARLHRLGNEHAQAPVSLACGRAAHSSPFRDLAAPRRPAWTAALDPHRRHFQSADQRKSIASYGIANMPYQ